jgi:hypothetical protein
VVATLPAILRVALYAHRGPALSGPTPGEPGAMTYAELALGADEIARGLAGTG